MPEPLMLPYSKAARVTFVRERPHEAVQLLSIPQLRSSGASEALVTQRLDFDDGIGFTVEHARANWGDAQGEPERALEQLVQLADSQRCSINDLLPLRCRVERHEEGGGLRVSVFGRTIGSVPQTFQSMVGAGEARITSYSRLWGSPSMCWKVRALPA
jgi:hypothetical protein